MKARSEGVSAAALGQSATLQPLRYKWLWLAAGMGALLLTSGIALLPIAALPAFPSSDKLLHFATFTFLAVWFLGIFDWRLAFPIAAGLLAYGVLIEVLQSFTAYRAPDIYDVLSDLGGIATGWLLAAVGLRHWCRRVEKILPGVSSP